MKKLLSILASLGLTVSATAAVISCGSTSGSKDNGGDKPKPEPKPEPDDQGKDDFNISQPDSLKWNEAIGKYVTAADVKFGKNIKKDSFVSFKDDKTDIDVSFDEETDKLTFELDDFSGSDQEKFALLIKFKDINDKEITKEVTFGILIEPKKDNFWIDSENQTVNLNFQNKQSQVIKIYLGINVDANSAIAEADKSLFSFDFDRDGAGKIIKKDNFISGVIKLRDGLSFDNLAQDQIKFSFNLIDKIKGNDKATPANGSVSTIQVNVDKANKSVSWVQQDSQEINDSNSVVWTIKDINNDLDYSNIKFKIDGDDSNIANHSWDANARSLVITFKNGTPASTFKFEVWFNLKNSDLTSSVCYLTAKKVRPTKAEAKFVLANETATFESDGTATYYFEKDGLGVDVDIDPTMITLTPGPNSASENNTFTVQEFDKEKIVIKADTFPSVGQTIINISYSLTDKSGFKNTIIGQQQVTGIVSNDNSIYWENNALADFKDTDSVIYKIDSKNTPSTSNVDYIDAPTVISKSKSNSNTLIEGTDFKIDWNKDKQELTITLLKEIEYKSVLNPYVFEVSFKLSDSGDKSNPSYVYATKDTAIKDLTTVKFDKTSGTFNNIGDSIEFNITHYGDDIDTSVVPELETDLVVGQDITYAYSPVKGNQAIIITLKREITGNKNFNIRFSFKLKHGYTEVSTAPLLLVNKTVPSENDVEWESLSADFIGQEAKFKMKSAGIDVDLTKGPRITNTSMNPNVYRTFWDANEKTFSIKLTEEVPGANYSFDVLFDNTNGYTGTNNAKTLKANKKDPLSSETNINWLSLTRDLQTGSSVSFNMSSAGIDVDTKTKPAVVSMSSAISPDKFSSLWVNNVLTISIDPTLDLQRGNYDFKVNFGLTNGYNGQSKDSIITVIKSQPSSAQSMVHVEQNPKTIMEKSAAWAINVGFDVNTADIQSSIIDANNKVIDPKNYTVSISDGELKLSVEDSVLNFGDYTFAFTLGLNGFEGRTTVTKIILSKQYPTVGEKGMVATLTGNRPSDVHWVAILRDSYIEWTFLKDRFGKNIDLSKDPLITAIDNDGKEWKLGSYMKESWDGNKCVLRLYTTYWTGGVQTFQYRFPFITIHFDINGFPGQELTADLYTSR